MKKIFQMLLIPALLLSCGGEAEQPAGDVGSTENQPPPAQQIRDPRRNDPVLDSLTNYLEENPTDADALAQRAERFLEVRNVSYAKADLDKALMLDSNRALVQRARGEYYLTVNETRISRDAWTKCIRLEPKRTDCRIKLAQLYTAVGEHRKSAQLVNEVIELDPYNARAYFIKGLNIRDLQKDTLQAIQYFQKAVDLDNTYIDAMDMLGVLYAAKKNPLAVAYYQNILAIDPNRSDVYYKLGVYYMDIQDWNKSLEAYTKAVQLNPKDVDSYFNLGYIHLELKLYRQATEYFTKAIAVSDYNYRALYGRAYAFEMMGDINNARIDYKSVLSIRPDYPPAVEGLKRVNKVN